VKKKDASENAAPLEAYRRVADGLAALFFPYVEIVLHDMATQTVAYIANNLSKRDIGDDSALDEIGTPVGDAHILGPYEKTNWDGRRLRSVSIVLPGDNGKPQAVMCVNYNIAVFEDVKAVIDTVLKSATVIAQPDALFKDDWQERINTFVHAWLRDRQLGLNTLSRDQKRELVEALDSEGAFSARSSASYVAKVLGMGRATVYKHISEGRTG
jgi:D-arginine utilization repressor